MTFWTGTLPQVTNRATYDMTVEIFDENGELMDLSGLDLFFTMTPVNDLYDGTSINASTDSGEVVAVGLGVAQITIAPSRMRRCAPANYNVGFAAVSSSDPDDACTIFKCTQSIIDGVTP